MRLVVLGITSLTLMLSALYIGHNKMSEKAETERKGNKILQEAENAVKMREEQIKNNFNVPDCEGSGGLEQCAQNLHGDIDIEAQLEAQGIR